MPNAIGHVTETAMETRNSELTSGVSQTPSPKVTIRPEVTRAYSYVRFSTPSQAAGASLQRQAERAAKYALEHGLTLDTELNMKDLGVSAFRGKNARTGALGGFLEAVQKVGLHNDRRANIKAHSSGLHFPHLSDMPTTRRSGETATCPDCPRAQPRYVAFSRPAENCRGGMFTDLPNGHPGF